MIATRVMIPKQQWLRLSSNTVCEHFVSTYGASSPLGVCGQDRIDSVRSAITGFNAP